MKFACLACCTALLLALFSGNGFAAPGDIARIQLGNCEVLAVSDVEGTSDTSILIGLSKEQRNTLVPSGRLQSQIIVFAVVSPERVILVDTGMGQSGMAAKALAAAGITPDAVNLVLLTHMHVDHISGMLDSKGQPLYPKAQLWVAEEEAAYWTSNEAMLALPKNKQKAFALPRAVLRAYGPRVHAFAPGQEIVPGIITVALAGHTPGHSGFLLEAQGNRLLFWGDIMHAAEVQFPAPKIAVTYDVDKERAVSTRLSLLQYLIGERIPFAGAHLPFPGIGLAIEKDNVITYAPIAK